MNWRERIFSWTLNSLRLFTRFLLLFFRIVEKHNTQSDMFWSMENPAKCRSHTLSRAFPDDSQSELFLTVAIVKQPIKALSTNSWKTAGYWNTISDAVSQTSLFRGWKEIGDVCTQATRNLRTSLQKILIYMGCLLLSESACQEHLSSTVKLTENLPCLCLSVVILTRASI